MKAKAGDFECEMYRVLLDGKLVEQDCIAPWSAQVLTREDFAGTYGRFLKSPGFAVTQALVGADGSLHENVRLRSVKRGEIAPEKFAAPYGYVCSRW